MPTISGVGERTMKVHFGCGKNRLVGWENLDLPGTDVTQRLPFEDATVDFIFHEHLLEHLDEVDGFNFLKECHRILKPQGVMRISCPNIEGIVWVYQNWDHIPDSPWKRNRGNRTHYINNAIHFQTARYVGKYFDPKGNVRHVKNSTHAHKYLDDEESLRRKLAQIGFATVVNAGKRKSAHPQLQNLEYRFGGMFKHFPQELEVILEATKCCETTAKGVT